MSNRSLDTELTPAQLDAEAIGCGLTKVAGTTPNMGAFRPSLEDVINAATRNTPSRLAGEIGRVAFLRKPAR